ncbi:MAG TPA: response regulator [Terriglobales bacterium]|nr:response regulator [Terriglobales bacterium]
MPADFEKGLLSPREIDVRAIISPPVWYAELLQKPRLRVLFVEDNTADVELSCAQLEMAGFRVEADVVDSAAAFEERVVSKQYDIILADYQLPNWTGLGTIPILQRHKRVIPVIMVSGSLGDEKAVACVKSGAVDYVLKDALERLPLTVRRVLSDAALRRVQAGLENQLHLMAAAIRTSDEGIVIVEAGAPLPDAKVVFLNEALERITGFPPLGTLRKTLQFHSPDEAAAFFDRIQNALSSENETCADGRQIPKDWRPVHDPVQRGVELEFHARDGALKVVEFGVMPSFVPGHHLMVFRDTTDRYLAHQELRRSEEQYRLLFEKNPHPMWVFDQETLAFLGVNEAAIQLYGYSREEFLKMSIKDIRPSEDIAGLDDLVGEEVSAGITNAGVWRHRKKNGEIIYAEITKNQIHFAQRRAVLILAVDCTARRLLENQFLQAQKMEAVGRLAGGVAHDFNNLLGVIVGYAQMLLTKSPSPERVNRSVQQIKKAAERAVGLTSQLLAFSRRQIIQPQISDLNNIIADLDPMLRRLIGEDIELTAIFHAQLWKVNVDPGQMQQVLMNLVVNARDAMPNGGEIVIETANLDWPGGLASGEVNVPTGPYVTVSVSDSGCGMDAATKAHLFEPFFTTKGKGKGTGLGLSTVYGIVKQNSGYIVAYSELAVGSSFTIYLPRAECSLEPAQSKAATQPVTKRRETVLLVEDQDLFRGMVLETLEENGYAVLEAHDGHEALEMCRRRAESIDLLLTDVVMPQMSGRQLADHLSPLYPSMKVIFMSGYTDDAIVQHGVLDPGVHFIAKPFTPENLLQKMHEVLDAPEPVL